MPAADLQRLKDRIYARMDNYLCEMQPDYDDSITGFYEAWDVVRKLFDELLSAAPAAGAEQGWRDISSAPNEGKCWVFGGRHTEPTLVSADGEWWRYAKKDGHMSGPTHWAPFIIPPPPSA